jgi:hypothetical protein
MNFKTGKINIPLWLLLLIGFTAITLVIAYWYYKIEPSNSKELGLAGGLLTGLIVYIVTFFTLLRPIIELDRFRRMGIKALLANRHDKEYYRKIVSTSKLRVDVLGASCRRFVTDFLDEDSDDAVLIDALNRNRQLKVRLLIPADTHMGEDTKAGMRATLNQVARLRQRFEGRVELRRFSDEARHSFVIVDDDLVAGPVFEDDKSRHAPAAHVATGTPFGQKYSVYFEKLWESAKSE